MDITRRTMIAAAALPMLAKALPAAASAPPPAAPATAADVTAAWATMLAGPPGETFAWWQQGILYAHVDRLREFPVAGFHAVLICRATADSRTLTLDARSIGCFSDLDSGVPTTQWRNSFTGAAQQLPRAFSEGPGRTVLNRADATLTRTAPDSRTNRIIASLETSGTRRMLTQIEATLQGFPGLDGKLPALDSPAITERQTRLQIIAPTADMTDLRGYFSHVYDALPPWLGFGDTLGSGLIKGQMRRARADEAVNAPVWAHLRINVPDAFAGGRLVL